MRADGDAAVVAPVSANDVFAGTMALFEGECLLRGVYGFARQGVAAASWVLARLPGVSLERPAVPTEASYRAAKGTYNAYAPHLGAAA